jgi:hypothetical protein
MGSDEAELARLLLIAAEKLAAVQGPIWSSYNSGADLASFVRDCRDKITQGAIEPDQARELWGIFAPTCDWDDVVGKVQLGDSIFKLLNKLYGPKTEKGV